MVLMSRLKTVLIVDDDDSFVSVVSKVLNMFDIGSFTADSIESAHEAIEASLPDLILLDLSLSSTGLTGLDFLRDRLSNHALRAIPVIILSSDGSFESIREALSLGADNYLIKPLNKKTFQSQLVTLGLTSVFN